MSAKDFSSKNNSIDKFISDSKKMEEDISNAFMNVEELYLEDIMKLYFKIINISSIAKAIKKNNGKIEKEIPEETLIKIQKTQNRLNEKFNETLHPRLISNLEKRIEEFKSNLKTNPKSKIQNEIEDQAKKFEELRKLMSTKEFVNQYAKVLGN